jgi:hypothetical protein
VLLVLGVVAAAGAAWIAQANRLDVLATAEWAVGLGIGIPVIISLVLLYAVLQRTALFQRDEARAEALRQRQAREASLVIDLEEGFGVGETAYPDGRTAVILQPHVKVRNVGTTAAPVHDWRAVLTVGEQRHALDHLTVRGPLEGVSSSLLPFLDRVGPLRPGLTVGYVQFLARNVSKAEFDSARADSDKPLSLAVTAYGAVQRWEGIYDFRAPYAQISMDVDPQSAAERLRSFSREAHRLQREMPERGTPAQVASFEPRVDQLVARVRDHVFVTYPERGSEFDAISAYTPATLSAAPTGDGRGADAYLADVLDLLDRIIREGV